MPADGASENIALPRSAAPVFHVVLVEPEIPPNTGNIGRLCLAAGAQLHLVKPLGFSLDSKQLRRAGLDYWDDVHPALWNSLPDLEAAADPDAGRWFFTVRADRPHWDAPFRRGDYLVFGPESRGLPASLLAQRPERCLRIPMTSTSPKVRSLNLATAAGIALYEAIRVAMRCPPPTPPQN